MNVNCESRDNWYLATIHAILRDTPCETEYSLADFKELIRMYSESETGLVRDWRTTAVLLECLGFLKIIRRPDQCDFRGMFLEGDRFVVAPGPVSIQCEVTPEDSGPVAHFIEAPVPLEIGTPVIDEHTGALAVITDWHHTSPELRYETKSIKGVTTGVRPDEIKIIGLGADSNAAIALRNAVGV